MFKNIDMLSIIIPAYNEEGTVVSVIQAVKQTLDNKDVVYELIVVNDGSTDKTKELVEKQDVILVNHPHCRGYGRALKTGIEKAKGDFVLTIDADDQNHTEDILKLIEHQDQYDLVIGARTNVSSPYRAFAKKILFGFANYLAQHKIPDLNSGFRLIKKNIVLKYFWLLPDSSSFSSTITFSVLKDGYNVKFIPTKEKPRKSGKSSIRPIKDSIRFFMIILRLGVLFNPSRVFLPLSITLFIIGIVWALFGAINFQGAASYYSIFVILLSVIIFFLGLLAGQIASIRRKIK